MELTQTDHPAKRDYSLQTHGFYKSPYHTEIVSFLFLHCLIIFKGLFQLIHKPFLLGFYRAFFRLVLVQGIACGKVEFPQSLFCFLVQLIRHLHYKGHIMVASHRFVAQGRNTLSFQAHLGVRLSTRLHIVDNISVYRFNPHIASQCCLCKTDRSRRENII